MTASPSSQRCSPPPASGWVTLRNALPHAKPRIQHNYYMTEDDTRTIIDGTRIALEIASRRALTKLRTADWAVPESDSDADILRFVAAQHPHDLSSRGDVRFGRGRRRGAPRSRRRKPARGRCLGDADRPPRQHQHAYDHGRREGRRPHSRTAAAAPRQRAARASVGDGSLTGDVRTRPGGWPSDRKTTPTIERATRLRAVPCTRSESGVLHGHLGEWCFCFEAKGAAPRALKSHCQHGESGHRHPTRSVVLG